MSDADRTRWDARWRGHASLKAPEPFLDEVAGRHLPVSGRALDLAGGTGRHALWLAKRGLTVTLTDVSPVALARAKVLAATEGLAIETVEVDFDTDEPPAGPWDVVVCTRFLDRGLVERVPSVLAPGGWFVWVHPTERNLDRHAKPSRRFLLAEGEARGLLRGLELVVYDEAWVHGVHAARVIARAR